MSSGLDLATSNDEDARRVRYGLLETLPEYLSVRHDLLRTLSRPLRDVAGSAKH